MKRPLITLLSASLLSVAGAVQLPGAPPSAGTTLDNYAILDYLDDTAQPATLTSNTVQATIQAVNGVTLTPTQGNPPDTCVYSDVVTAGQTGVQRYTITNTGNTADTYTLSDLIPVNPSALQNAVFQISTTADFDPIDKPYDPATSINTTQVNLQPYEQITVFLVYTVSSSATGGTLIGIDPTATSGGTATVSSTGGRTCITVKQSQSLTLTPNNENSAARPATVYTSHELTNTGNAPLTASEITLTETNQNFDVKYQVTGQGAAQPTGGTWYDTPQQALDAYLGSNTLANGSSVTIWTQTTMPGSATINSTDTNTLTAYVNTAPDAQTDVVTSQANPAIATDKLTVLGGIAAIVKLQANCGVDGTACPTPSAMLNAGTQYQAPIDIKPCEKIRYVIAVSNTGTAPIKRPAINDTLPRWLASIQLTSLQANSLYSLDAGNTWAASVAPFDTLSATQNVRMSLDNGDAAGAGKLDDTDTLPAGENMVLVVDATIACSAP